MTTTTNLTAAQRRVRATRRVAASTFYTTGAATIAANMYASEHTFVGLATGFWTPVALFLALEMVERVVVKDRKLNIIRRICLGVIVLMAAWVSYWHLVHIFTLGGADPVAAHGMPITVDALMVLARHAMVHKALPTPAARRKPQAKAKVERSLKVV